MATSSPCPHHKVYCIEGKDNSTWYRVAGVRAWWNKYQVRPTQAVILSLPLPPPRSEAQGWPTVIVIKDQGDCPLLKETTFVYFFPTDETTWERWQVSYADKSRCMPDRWSVKENTEKFCSKRVFTCLDVTEPHRYHALQSNHYLAGGRPLLSMETQVMILKFQHSTVSQFLLPRNLC